MSDKSSRLADIDTLTSGVKWRWGLVCVGGVILSVGHSLGIAELSPWVIAIFVTVDPVQEGPGQLHDGVLPVGQVPLDLLRC